MLLDEHTISWVLYYMEWEKKQEYYLKKFIMINNKFDVSWLVIDTVWLTNYNHFRKLYESMDSNNMIDFSCLWLKIDAIKRIRVSLHRAGFIRKIKITDPVWFAWYLNPYLVNKSNKTNSRLKEVFKYNEYKAPKWDTYENIINIIF